MSIHPTRRMIAIAGLKNVAAVGEELDRRVWLDDHPGALYHPDDSLQQKKEELEAAMDKETDAVKLKGMFEDLRQIDAALASTGEPASDFDLKRVRGAAGMYSFCVKNFGQTLHDIAPSEGGVGRRQAIGLGQAQKTGVSTEPKKASLFQKITGRGNTPEQKAGTNAQ